MRSQLSLPLQIAALLLALASADALAREVNVNGRWMGERQLAILDRMSCLKVPDGAYWVNPQTLQWGFQGGGPVGFIGDHCRRNRPNQPQPPVAPAPQQPVR